MAEPSSARGDVEPADEERAYAHGNPRQRRNLHNNNEMTVEMETRLLIRGSSRRHVAGETTPTRDRVRL